MSDHEPTTDAAGAGAPTPTPASDELERTLADVAAAEADALADDPSAPSPEDEAPDAISEVADAAPEVADAAPEQAEPVEVTAEPVAETEAAPAAEPVAETLVESAAEPAAQTPVEAVAEPAVEPVSEPAVEPAVERVAETTETTDAAPEQPGTEADATASPADAEPAEPAEPAETAEDDATAPAPGTTPRPGPRPVPRPPTAAVRPVAVAAPLAPAAPVPPVLSPAEAAEAARWGRVDDDGTVWVREQAGERVVGQYAGADPADALAFYVRRFGELHAKLVLAEARLAGDVPVKEVDATLTHLAEELAEPAAVGDLDSLRERLTTLRGIAAERKAAADAERAAAKQAAVAARTALVEQAEAIAATDPARMQWRPAGEQLRVLLDQWKDAQRHGPRVDRPTEDALWKRFSHARSAFDRERRRHFADLEKVHGEAKAAKAALVAQAESLATSTDWGGTAGAFRDLMTQWKSSGRAARKDDDALWARFRAAQDAFFAARDAVSQQTDAEYSANLEVKLRLLEEAERLVPVKDLPAARAALRDLQERWESAGKVPRGDVQRVEGRMRAVEQAVRDAEQTQWQRSNPETRARAEGALAQLTAAIAGLEADLEKARATGDARAVERATAALEARRAWLEQVERAAADSR